MNVRETPFFTIKDHTDVHTHARIHSKYKYSTLKIYFYLNCCNHRVFRGSSGNTSVQPIM